MKNEDNIYIYIFFFFSNQNIASSFRYTLKRSHLHIERDPREAFILRTEQWFRRLKARILGLVKSSSYSLRSFSKRFCYGLEFFICIIV